MDATRSGVREVRIQPEVLDRIASMQRTIGELVVSDQASLETATEIGKLANEALKRLERDRRELTDPLNSTVKAINARYKKVSEQIDTIKSEAKRKATAYVVAEEKRKKQEIEEATLKAAESLEQSGDAAAADTLLAAGSEYADKGTGVKARTETGAQSVKKVRWAFELTEIRMLLAAAVANPELWAKYLTLDADAVRAAVAAGVREIPGVRVYQDISVEFR